MERRYGSDGTLLECDQYDGTWEWMPRCPRCFSRELNRLEEPGFSGCMTNELVCRECGLRLKDGESKRSLPKTGGYMEVLTLSERKE